MVFQENLVGSLCMISDILVGVSLGDHGYRHRSYRLFGVAMFEVPGRSLAPQKDFADLYIRVLLKD